jgi:hypothetical protein
MHSTAWVASHVAALVSIQWLAPLAGGISPNWLLYGIPLSVGVVQWAFLSQSLRWYGLLWLPSCLVGLSLSFFGSWWFLCVLGLGMGIAQSPILALSGFRRWWMWVPASGFGWFIGMVLGSSVQDLLGAVLDTDEARMSVLYGGTALVYGALTAAAFQLMPRVQVTAKRLGNEFDA